MIERKSSFFHFLPKLYHLIIVMWGEKKKKKLKTFQCKLGGDILPLNWSTASTVTREGFNTSLFYKSVFEKYLLEVICIYKKSSLLQGVVWGCLYFRTFFGQVQTVCMPHNICSKEGIILLVSEIRILSLKLLEDMVRDGILRKVVRQGQQAMKAQEEQILVLDTCPCDTGTSFTSELFLLYWTAHCILSTKLISCVASFLWLTRMITKQGFFPSVLPSPSLRPV